MKEGIVVGRATFTYIGNDKELIYFRCVIIIATAKWPKCIIVRTNDDGDDDVISFKKLY